MELDNKSLTKKVGNLMLYIAKKFDGVHLTKLLKLLYLIDEESVKESGLPVTWLKYKVWKMGPVSKSVYSEIAYYQNKKFNEYITFDKDDNTYFIKPNNKFCDDEFSDYELGLINRVLTKYHNTSGKQLVEICHSPGTIWFKIVNEKNLTHQFKNDLLPNTSPFEIDLNELNSDDKLKQELYEHTKESMSFFHQLES